MRFSSWARCYGFVTRSHHCRPQRMRCHPSNWFYFSDRANAKIRQNVNQINCRWQTSKSLNEKKWNRRPEETLGHIKDGFLTFTRFWVRICFLLFERANRERLRLPNLDLVCFGDRNCCIIAYCAIIALVSIWVILDITSHTHFSS